MRWTNVAFVLKRVSVFLLLILFFITLTGCNKPDIIVDNPYFEDSSKDDYASFRSKFNTYIDQVNIYYSDTYYDDAFYHSFDYQTQDGYQPLEYKNTYTKDELSINDDLLDQRRMFKYSELYQALDNSRHIDMWILKDIDVCGENVLCENSDGDFMHYSMHEDEVYYHYYVHAWSGQIDEYMYYFSMNRNKLHLTFFHKSYNEFSFELEHVNYVEYVEGEKEINMHNDGGIFLSLYDIQSGSKLEKELISLDYYGIKYYDVLHDIEFWTHIHQSNPMEMSTYLTLFQNHRVVMRITKTSTSMSHYDLRLNAFSGWNEFYVTQIDGYPNQDAYIALDGQVLAEELSFGLDRVMGDVFIFNPQPNDIDILASYHILPPYEDASILLICNDFQSSISSLEYQFNLYQTNQELLDRFNDKTNSNLSLPS